MVKKFLGLFLIVLILGGGGFVIWEGKNMIDDYKKTNQSLVVQLQEQIAENEKLKNKNTELKKDMKKLEKAVEENEKAEKEDKKENKEDKNDETKEEVVELLNTEKLKISSVSMIPQSDKDGDYYEFTFEVVNKSKKEIEISAKDVTFDEKSVKDDLVELSQSIEPGTRETVQMKVVAKKDGKLPSLEELAEFTFVVVRDGDDENIEEYPATIELNK